MRNNTIIFFDFEATSANPNEAQPAQLAAVAINPYKLEIPNDGIFNSYIKPEFCEESCEKLGLAPVTDKFYDITKIPPKKLERAADLGTVWGEFQNFVAKFHPKQDSWSAPIRAGYNIVGYDNIIVDRICGGHIVPDSIEERIWGFGPRNKDRQQQSLFNRVFQIDLLHLVWMWFEGDQDIKSFSMDSLRQILGMDTEHAHDALYDVVQGAFLVIKFMDLHRRMYFDTAFHGAFQRNNTNDMIKDIVEKNWKD